MNEATLKLTLFRTIDQLQSEQLLEVYQFLSQYAEQIHLKKAAVEKSEMEKAYQQMAEDEAKGIRFEEEENWNFATVKEAVGTYEAENEYGYLASLSEEKYAKLELAYQQMAEDEAKGIRNFEW